MKDLFGPGKSEQGSVREIVLSDITVMGAGYCVIGLEQTSPDAYRSVRPMPPRGFAWREPFPFRRGDCVRFRPAPVQATRPHTEDLKSSGLIATGRSLNEPELMACLWKAEVSRDLEHLFGCAVQVSQRGGSAVWVNPADAARSICGCTYKNLRFRIFPEPEGFNLRAEIVLNSNERLSSIPIVDREWRRFATQVVQRVSRSDRLPFSERFLNKLVQTKLLLMPYRFARIGLPRPRSDQQCWLMLDSLFPQPDDSWLGLL